MSTPFELLLKILDQEKNLGYRNECVIGGLDKFAAHWEQEVGGLFAVAGDRLQVQEIVRRLRAYPSLRDASARRAALDEVRAATETLQVRSGAAPAAAQAPAPAVRQEPPPIRGQTALPRPSGQGLNAPVSVVVGVSEVHSKRLARLGVETVRDLLYLYPRRYRDYSAIKPVSSLQVGEEATVIGEVWETANRRARSGITVTTTLVADGTGLVEAIWFNQPYLLKQLQTGRKVILSGTVGLSSGHFDMQSPEWELMNGEPLHTARLVPVYPLTEGITSKWLRRVQKRTVDYWARRVPDPLPNAVRERLDLADLGSALEQIHFPDDAASLERARRRLCFDEFLLIQLGVLRQRRLWRGQPGRALAVRQDLVSGFIGSLPFALTGAQQRATEQVLADIAQPVPMSRLLQGDVGSGKTVVALIAMLVATDNGAQAALMAPTEILAEQHHRTISDLVGRAAESTPGWRVPSVRLVTGSLARSDRARAREEIASGQAEIVVGTHALIQQDVQFKELALTVIDEQHRFGVMQRSVLRDKGYHSHVLVMSATPIPRSLSLTVYGDLDLSVIDELPPGRQVVKTHWLTSRERERAYKFVRGQVEKGRQAFVICPLIEESDTLEVKSAVEEHRRLQEEVFPDLRIGLLHGKMRADEKDDAMALFRSGEVHVLVSTSVVEVGIDVPNATVMLIEGADRFGLAQLHQFRGRVGRGEFESYCLLIADQPTLVGTERLAAIETMHDGFALAEKDLELRGPGEFFGTRQSGLPNLRLAKLSDTKVLETARKAAIQIMEVDPSLSLPEHQLLAQKLEEFWRGRGDLS